MTDIIVRHAEEKDTETVAQLVHALLEELGDVISLEEVSARAERILAHEAVVALIALDNDTPIGVAVLNECHAIYAGGAFGEISELYVRPDMRSKGVAVDLIEKAIAEGGKRNWKRLEVGAPDQPKWRRTLDFYLRNGFEEVGPRLRYLM